jgi:hypothetical protein
MNKNRNSVLSIGIIIGMGILLTSFVLNNGNNTLGKANTLTKKEIKEGWTLLWDGKTFDGWRGIYENDFPSNGWIIEDDQLICMGNEMPDSLRGGDIITDKKYGSFELKCEFKIKEKANSGIKYFINESLKASPGHGLGLEYAILDNENWPYDKPDYNRTCGSLYDLIRAPDNAITKPMGEWNKARIVVDGNHIEHWLNGTKTVEIEKGSKEYYQLVEKSKYANIENWGEFKEGHILLQDEGPRTAFRNIKIRVIDND